MIYPKAKRRNAQHWTTDHFSIYAATFNRRSGFAHEVTIYPATVDPGYTFEPAEGLQRWENRSWESFTYESALQRAIEKLPATLRTLATHEIMEARKASERAAADSMFKAFKTAYDAMPNGCKRVISGATIESTEDAQRVTGIMAAVGILCKGGNP